MKIITHQPVEIEVKTIRLELAVRYDDEDMPYDFPLRKGDMWIADVDIDSGKIKDWPEGKSGEFHMKVCDCGTYRLFDAQGKEVAAIEGDYVPNRIVPGEYGDYAHLVINEQGLIMNWPRHPNVCQFFDGNED